MDISKKELEKAKKKKKNKAYNDEQLALKKKEQTRKEESLANSKDDKDNCLKDIDDTKDKIKDTKYLLQKERARLKLFKKELERPVSTPLLAYMILKLMKKLNIKNLMISTFILETAEQMVISHRMIDVQEAERNIEHLETTLLDTDKLLQEQLEHLKDIEEQCGTLDDELQRFKDELETYEEEITITQKEKNILKLVKD